MNPRIGVQLYTLRNEARQDFPSVLRALSEMGYEGVEFAGLQGWPLEQIVAVLRETGLVTAGMHVPYARLMTDLPAVVAEAEALGCRTLVCPWLPLEMRNEATYRQLRKELNQVAEALAGSGLRLSYHNHDFEFAVEIDGQTALEYLLEPVPGNRILAEIDVYWAQKAGLNPAAFIQPYRGRMPLIHLKDMTPDELGSFAEIGTGQVEFRPILAWCQEAGVEWLVVEQDLCAGSPFDSVRLSLQNLRGLLTATTQG
ncbi:MAG: sugar phosphate isomerase/epimerase family protein [Bacillota bacterium]